MAEEAALGTSVSMVVVGDVSHVIVDVELAELRRSYFSNPIMHVSQVFDGWLGSMKAPHDHRYRADLALRDPTDVILVIPSSNARGAAEIAAIHLHEGGLGHSSATLLCSFPRVKRSPTTLGTVRR